MMGLSLPAPVVYLAKVEKWEKKKPQQILMHSVVVPSLSVDSTVWQCVIIIKTFNLKLSRTECLQMDICIKQEV